MVYILSVGVLFSLSLALLNRALRGTGVIRGLVAKTALPGELLNILSYVLLHEYIILLAWKDYILKNYTVTWQKVESTRNLKGK